MKGVSHLSVDYNAVDTNVENVDAIKIIDFDEEDFSGPSIIKSFPVKEVKGKQLARLKQHTTF